MDSFANIPTDEQLSELKIVSRPTFSHKLIESDTVITATPTGIPLYYLGLMIAFPLIIVVIYTIFHWLNYHSLSTNQILMILATIPAFIILFILFRMIKKLKLPVINLFVADKQKGMLSLIICKGYVTKKSICGFFEIRGTVEEISGKRKATSYVSELNVLVKNKAGKIERFPMFACSFLSKVTSTGKMLAKFFDSPFRKVNLKQQANTSQADT